jgi:hypothetical protein
MRFAGSFIGNERNQVLNGGSQRSYNKAAMSWRARGSEHRQCVSEIQNVVDFVAVDPGGDVLLVMVEGREGMGRLNNSFSCRKKSTPIFRSRWMDSCSKEYPELAGPPVCIELRCLNSPDPTISGFIEMVSEKLKEENVRFRIKQIGPVPS